MNIGVELTLANKIKQKMEARKNQYTIESLPEPGSHRYRAVKYENVSPKKRTTTIRLKGKGLAKQINRRRYVDSRLGDLTLISDPQKLQKPHHETNAECSRISKTKLLSGHQRPTEQER